MAQRSSGSAMEICWAASALPSRPAPSEPAAMLARPHAPFAVLGHELGEVGALRARPGPRRRRAGPGGRRSPSGPSRRRRAAAGRAAAPSRAGWRGARGGAGGGPREGAALGGPGPRALRRRALRRRGLAAPRPPRRGPSGRPWRPRLARGRRAVAGVVPSAAVASAEAPGLRLPPRSLSVLAGSTAGRHHRRRRSRPAGRSRLDGPAARRSLAQARPARGGCPRLHGRRRRLLRRAGLAASSGPEGRTYAPAAPRRPCAPPRLAPRLGARRAGGRRVGLGVRSAGAGVGSRRTPPGLGRGGARASAGAGRRARWGFGRRPSSADRPPGRLVPAAPVSVRPPLADPRAPATFDEELLNAETPAVAAVRTDADRIRRMRDELAHGFRRMAPIPQPAVSVFGSARTPPDNPEYALAAASAPRSAPAGFSVITGGGPGADGGRQPRRPRRPAPAPSA